MQGEDAALPLLLPQAHQALHTEEVLLYTVARLASDLEHCGHVEHSLLHLPDYKSLAGPGRPYNNSLSTSLAAALRLLFQILDARMAKVE